jgi:uncharacterized membrane protein YdbT with pleckstrin-like domain
MTVRDFLKDIDSDEEVILLIRKHWLQFLPIIFSSTILLFLAGIFFILPGIKGLTEQYYYLAIAAVSIMASFAILSLQVAWILNRLTFGILTNKRIIDIDQTSLFNRQVTQARLDKIEDITVETNGFLRTILNVGQIHVMTAGEVPNIEFMFVKNAPKKVELIHKHQDNLYKPKTN